MPEPNATVDPFDSAGIRLPTEGKGYSGTDSATDVTIAAALGGPVPQNNVVPGPQTFVAVDVPFAAGGEVIEIQFSSGFVPDNTNLTPATFGLMLAGIADSSLVPQQFFVLETLGSTTPVALALTDVATIAGQGAFEVPDGLVYPLTVFLVYIADGDAIIGQDQTLGFFPTCSFRVQRVKRERVLQVPPANLI
jgi:hypothetical protein